MKKKTFCERSILFVFSDSPGKSHQNMFPKILYLSLYLVPSTTMAILYRKIELLYFNEFPLIANAELL